MRLILLTALTMTAFAANSILNRLAVDGGFIDPGSFAVLRVFSGAVVLGFLVWRQGKSLQLFTAGRLVGAGSLAVYMVGFSVAYVTLDAGLGALILFGVVQITMFSLSTFLGSPPFRRQIVGAAVAFAGLVWVLWPVGGAPVGITGPVFMVAAGIGWAVYTLAGRSEPDALAGTAANFCMALPLTLVAPLIAGAPLALSLSGVVLATLSGAVTSGLGYALWYSIIPRLTPATAAIVQLAVPVIALVAGVLLLGETAGMRLVVGAVLVLGGIALAVRK